MLRDPSTGAEIAETTLKGNPNEGCPSSMNRGLLDGTALRNGPSQAQVLAWVRAQGK